jgi:hypothetical protein
MSMQFDDVYRRRKGGDQNHHNQTDVAWLKSLLSSEEHN